MYLASFLREGNKKVQLGSWHGHIKVSVVVRRVLLLLASYILFK